MRICNLTDDQLCIHAANHAKVARWAGSSESVASTMGGIAAAMEELIDRRAAMTDLRRRTVMTLREVPGPGDDVVPTTMGTELALPVDKPLNAGMDSPTALTTNVVGDQVSDLFEGEPSTRHSESLTPTPVDAPGCTESEAR